MDRCMYMYRISLSQCDVFCKQTELLLVELGTVMLVLGHKKFILAWAVGGHFSPLILSETYSIFALVWYVYFVLIMSLNNEYVLETLLGIWCISFGHT